MYYFMQYFNCIPLATCIMHVEVQLVAKTSTNIVELKTGLNFKGISVTTHQKYGTCRYLEHGRKHCLLTYNTH